jgi:outer membrane protein insertion porin family
VAAEVASPEELTSPQLLAQQPQAPASPGLDIPNPFATPEAGTPPLRPDPSLPGTPVLKPGDSTGTESAPSEPRVMISEVVIQGLDNHPEKDRLEQAAYGALRVTPGTQVTRSQLRTDLQAVYATGLFSDVRIQPVDSALGVRLLVQVTPNPVLKKISLDPPDAQVPAAVVQDTFAADLGKTLNLTTLQTRMQELQKWYADQGYSLARVTGPSRVSPDGDVQLVIRQGLVQGVEVQFLNKEGSTTNDKGEPIRGKTKSWVVTREISLKPGQIFNARHGLTLTAHGDQHREGAKIHGQINRHINGKPMQAFITRDRKAHQRIADMADGGISHEALDIALPNGGKRTQHHRSE